MIKDIDNAVILNVSVYDVEKDTIKDGDILVYNAAQSRWELCKTGLTLTSTIFGVVCDTNDGSLTRDICIEGIVEANISEASHSTGEPVWLNSETNYFDFVMPVRRIPNGFLLKYLPAKYGNVRGLVKIWNNTNTAITTA